MSPQIEFPRQRPTTRKFVVDDEIVLIAQAATADPSLQSSERRAIALNSSGRAIWDLCDGSRSVDDISDTLAVQFRVNREMLSLEVRDTLTKLSALNLLENAPPALRNSTTNIFVIGIEDKPYFRWQAAIFLESLHGKLPPGWNTLVVVCNNREPISAELRRVLDNYDTLTVQASNHARRFPLDAGNDDGAYHGALNRVEALAAAAQHVADDGMIYLLDSDTFVYRELNAAIMPKQTGLAWNWHVDHKPFFSSTHRNDPTKGIDLQKLLQAIGCKMPFRPGGVNVFVEGRVAKNKKFIGDCFRFAQALFILGRIAGVKDGWTAEMPCFALALTANDIPFDLLKNEEFLVPSCSEQSIPEGSIYHYYSDPGDFGSGAFRNSKWHKQAYHGKDFLRTDFRHFEAAAQSEQNTDHERYFFELAEKARKRVNFRKTPQHLEEMDIRRRERAPLLGIGFRKTRLDGKLYQRLLEHFRSSVHKFKSEPANEYLQTENKSAYPSLLYQDDEFNLRLLNDLQGAHEAWSGQPLMFAACYGIRVYQPGSYLYSHTDRITHIVSSTICIDHRLSNRWPLYIEDLEGRPHEISVEPGEMVFFEGARLAHGRPYPLDGEYYANIFMHYTPMRSATSATARRRSKRQT
jgi:hypothetical protein